MTVKQRLQYYIKTKGITVRAFEKSVTLSNGYVNNISKSISEEKLHLISQHYPELNPVWLMMGEGEMLLEKKILGYKDVLLSSVQNEPKDLDNIQIEQATLRMAEANKNLTIDNIRLREEIRSLKRTIENLKTGQL